MRRVAAVVLTVVAFGVIGAAAQADDEAPVIERKIALGAVAGRIDHLGIDLARKRLLVAELGNNSVAVVDLAQGKLLTRLSRLREPQGVGYAPKADLIYVANAADGAVAIISAGDLSPVAKVNLGADADNIRPDGPDRMIVGYGDGALAVLDAASGKRLADIPLAAHPESFQLDAAANRVYVNLPEANRVAVIDRAAGAEVARWGLPGAAANFPMALDAAENRLFVGYRRPPVLAAFDTRSGEALAKTSICGDADDLFYDPARKRVYVSCGEGFLAVLDASGAGLREVARVATEPGARTALFVPELDRLFVAVRAQGSDPAAIWEFRLP
jgi:DNA-binding beta-propeller fold protein YncE